MTALPLADCCAPIAESDLDQADALALERLFQALADRHRITIVNILARAGEAVCVCELVPVLGLAQATVSYHLKQLVDAGLVTRERRGTYAYYTLAQGVLERMQDVFRARS